MIPKLIHQTAKTAELDERCQRYANIVRRLHPDWTYKLWTDADNDAFVRAEYPDFYPVFAGLPKGIMRADVIRYLLMDKLGGLYLDTDYEMLRPFDMLHYGAVVPFENDAADRNGGPKQLGNAFFAAAPGSSFFKEVIRVLASRGPLANDADVIASTGPAFITTVYDSRPAADWTDLHTPSRELFCPLAPRNEREYTALLADKQLYGIHHCYGTWRENSPYQRLRTKLSQLYRRLT